MEQAHSKSFDKLCNLITERVLQQQEIMKLSDALQYYVGFMRATKYPCPDYRAEKVKQKLQNHDISRKISFTSFEISKGKFFSQLIFSNALDTRDAVKLAYKLGTNDSIAQVAETLRESIKQSFSNLDKMTWPPSVEYLKNTEGVLPEEVEHFLKIVLSGSKDCESVRVNRLVLSIGQDICRGVTNGKWTMPKHILLCMTLRHMFRSKELLILLNKFGHCQGYSYSLELETAIAKAVQESASLLPASIIRHPVSQSVFHSEFDNFEIVNELYGAGSVHTAHGIMLQDIVGEEMVDIESATVPRTRERSLKELPDSNLPECYMTIRCGPNMATGKDRHEDGLQAFNVSKWKNIMWVSLRDTERRVPGWGGFVSVTEDPPQRLTTIGYYPVIHNPITEYKTVKECLRIAEEATQEVGQEYTITTFDLGVCMKAYPLIWNEPEMYQKHVILIGTFHLTCAYFHMIGKKMDSCGLSDVLLEAGLVGSGTVYGVFSGKNYSRAMVCHKTVLESLERLLMKRFVEHKGESNFFDNLTETAKLKLNEIKSTVTKDKLNDCINDTDIRGYIQKYCQFREDVANGALGKTPQFWVAYMDAVWLALQLHESVKRNDSLLYAECIHCMPDLFFAYNGHNYARYMTMFSLFLANIDETHPGAIELLKLGAFSVARSMVPGSRTDVDKTMEETFMKHSKSHGGASGAGISGITRNYAAYQR